MPTIFKIGALVFVLALVLTVGVALQNTSKSYIFNSKSQAAPRSGCEDNWHKSKCVVNPSCVWEYVDTKCIAETSCPDNNYKKGDCWGFCATNKQRDCQQECQWYGNQPLPRKQGHCVDKPPTPPNPPPPPPPPPPPKPKPTLPRVDQLTNGSFETDANSDKLPDSWAAIELTTDDRLDKVFTNDLVYSFRFLSSKATSVKRQLGQWINYKGTEDEVIVLDFWHHADRADTTRKAGVVVVTFDHKGRKVGTTSMLLPKGAHNWLKKQMFINAPGPEGSYKIFLFVHNSLSSIRFDGLQVSTLPKTAVPVNKVQFNELDTTELSEFE